MITMVIELNRYLQETDIPERITKRKTTLIQKDPEKEPLSNTYNVLNDDVENTNDTNKGGDLLFTNKPRTLPQGTERMPHKDQWNRRATIHSSTYPQGE